MNTKDNRGTPGKIKKGRGHLGAEVAVEAYRLFEDAVCTALMEQYGEEACADIMKTAGRLAGEVFAKSITIAGKGLNEFIAELQKKMREMKIGIMRIESVEEAHKIVIILTISEHISCSDMQNASEAASSYDEGFVEGLFTHYTKKPFSVKEVDCWAKGDTVCRFVASEVD